MSSVIVAKNLTKEYSQYVKGDLFKIDAIVRKKSSTFAVDSINLSIDEGDFIAVMGPSGAGKSTLINMLSTLDTPTKGSVSIYGKSLNTLREKDIAEIRYKTIGFVFQDFNLLELLTCRENIAMPLTLKKESKKEVDKKVDEIAKILGVEDLLDKYPAQCSGGEKQRIATARALVAGPKILVADEPTGNLDSKNSKAVMNFFKNINNEKNITIIMVTHDATVALYARKVLYIKDGRIGNEIDKENKTQKEFFKEILDLVSEEKEF